MDRIGNSSHERAPHVSAAEHADLELSDLSEILSAFIPVEQAQDLVNLLDPVNRLFSALQQNDAEGFNEAVTQLVENIAIIGNKYAHELPDGFDSSRIGQEILQEAAKRLSYKEKQQILRVTGNENDWADFDPLAMGLILSALQPGLEAAIESGGPEQARLIDIHTRIQCYNSPFQASNVAQRARLGRGSLSEVSQHSYTMGTPGSKEEIASTHRGKAFKPLVSQERLDKELFCLMGLNEGDIDIEDASQRTLPRIAGRNLVVSDLADLLGTDVIARVSSAKHKGELGIVMELCTPGMKLSPDRGGSVDRTLTLAFFQKNLSSSRGQETWKKLFAVNQLIEDLMYLQIVDTLTGQLDRHFNNIIFLFNEGKYVGLKAIDHDLSCGSLIEPFIERELPDGQIVRYTQHRVGYPRVLTEAMYDKIMALDKDQISAISNMRLIDSETDAIVKRLDKLKEVAQNIKTQGRIIEADKWNSEEVKAWLLEKDESVEGMMGHPKNASSYYGANYNFIEPYLEEDDDIDLWF